MNFVTRALTQNLRDIQTNWAGSSAWLQRMGMIVGTLVVTGALGGWLKNLVLGGATEGSRLLLANAVHAVFLGLALAIIFGLGFESRGAHRLFVATWLVGSAFAFLSDLPLPGWASYCAMAAAGLLLGGFVALFRVQLRGYFAPSRSEKESKGESL